MKKANGEQKRGYHHGHLKSALVDAGIEILESQGLPALSLRAIAARVGVSHTAPKNHFGSLRGLLTAIAAEAFRRHAAFMRSGVSDASNRQQRLTAAIEGYVRFAVENKGLFLLMFSDHHCDFADADLQTAAAESYAVLADISTGLDWGKQDGPDGQRRTEFMLWSFAHGYAQLYNAGHLHTPSQGYDFNVTDVMPAFSYLPAKEAEPSK